MADISDVTAYLASAAANAVYPNGTTQPSVANMDVVVFEGWPIPEVLDMDLTARQLGPSGTPIARPGGARANVSIYPMQGTNEKIYQILDATYVIAPPVFGLSLQLATPPSGTTTYTLTVNGTPGATEFVTIEIDQIYISSAKGANAAAICAALAAQINGFASLSNPLVPGYVAIANNNVLTISGAAYVVPRVGAQGTLGKVVYRERQSVMVTTWAPNKVVRDKIAAAIDVLIKQSLTVQMPDTSTALIVYNRTNLTDELEPVACYRRDLVYCVDYATVAQFPGTVITSATIQIAPIDTQTENFIGVTQVA